MRAASQQVPDSNWTRTGLVALESEQRICTASITWSAVVIHGNLEQSSVIKHGHFFTDLHILILLDTLRMDILLVRN